MGAPVNPTGERSCGASFGGATIIGLLLGLVPLAQAQGTYPDRPIRFVVAFPPGGATDTFFRLISNELGTALGQSIVIENKGGAGGYIAWQMVAAAPADGYTVLVAENAIGINQALFKKHPSGFNPLKDYDAVGAMGERARWCGRSPTTSPPTASPNSWRGRRPCRAISTTATPGPAACRISSPRSFSTAPACRPFRCRSRAAGRRRRRSPAGSSPWSCRPWPVAKPQMEGKLVKGLLVTSAKRSPAMPDVPTLKELGIKVADVDLEFWWGLFVPKGTPEPIRAKIEKALQATMANPVVRERLAKVDTDPSFAPGPALRVKLENEINNWSKFIDAKGIKVEQ